MILYYVLLIPDYLTNTGSFHHDGVEFSMQGFGSCGAGKFSWQGASGYFKNQGINNIPEGYPGFGYESDNYQDPDKKLQAAHFNPGIGMSYTSNRK